MSTKKNTVEEIYRRALENIRDFCRDRESNIYCSQILKKTTYSLIKGQQLKKPLFPINEVIKPNFMKLWRKNVN